MKNSLILLALLLIGSTTFAQLEVGPQKPNSLSASFAPLSAAKTLSCIDTLNMYQQRTDSFTIFSAPGGGYIFGTGASGTGQRLTDGTGVHFDSVGTVTVEEIFVWIAEKQLVGSPDNLKMNLYNAAPDSMPFNLVGFGQSNMAFVTPSTTVNFQTMTGLTKFTISTGTKQVTGDFFLALDYTAMDDTFGVVAGIQGKGAGEKRTRQLLSSELGGSWVRVWDFWNFGGDPMDTDIMMIPIVECVVSANEPGVFSNEHFTVHPAFPNPAANSTRIGVDLPKATGLEIWVFDLQGRTLFEQEKQTYPKGKHEIEIDLRDFAPGTYYYQVRTDESSVASRFVVSK